MRSPCSALHGSLCLYHARLEDRLDDRSSRTPEAAALLAEFGQRQFTTRIAVNSAISQLISLRCRKLISARDAAFLGSMLRLAIQTLNGLSSEFTQLPASVSWGKVVDKSVREAFGKKLADERQSDLVAAAEAQARAKEEEEAAREAEAAADRPPTFIWDIPAPAREREGYVPRDSQSNAPSRAHRSSGTGPPEAA